MKRRRGRPAKEKGQRKDVDLRIPVTADQKEMVMQAVRSVGGDMATWARPILLEAARKVLEKIGGVSAM